MKVSMQLLLLWSASLSLFSGAGALTLMAPEWMNGVLGLTTLFFLGYCSIIVVAQVYAAMGALCLRPEDFSGEEQPGSSGY
jgi:hypothetical protein